MSRHHRSNNLPRGAWAQLRRHVFNRDGWQCVLCGSRARLECDHIKGLGDGGSNSLDNLRTLCRSCHLKLSGRRHRIYQVDGQDDWQKALNAKGKRRAEF